MSCCLYKDSVQNNTRKKEKERRVVRRGTFVSEDNLLCQSGTFGQSLFGNTNGIQYRKVLRFFSIAEYVFSL